MSEDATLDEFVEAESDSSEPENEDLARKTVCGIPPQDWTVARLGELVRVVSGNSLPKEYQSGKEGEHPVYKVSDMNATGNQKYVSDTSNRLSKGDLEKINHTLYPEGTTILPKVGAALLTNKRRMLTEPSSFDNNVMGWVPDKTNPEFLYYVSCMIDMEAVAQKGAVPSISKAIAKSLKLPSPPLPEQRKIATALYTVDQAIEKTEEIIEQSDRIFRGMMSDIFEQGVSSPDRLQETPVGRFPKSWDIVQMKSILTEKPSYGIVKTGDGDKNGVRMIRAQDIEHGKLVEDEPIRVTKAKSEEYERTKISEGNVLLSVMGTVGRSMCATQDMEGCNVNRALAVLKFENSQVLPEFADFWFRSPHVQSYFETQKFGTAQPRLNLGFLRKMKFPVPPINIQKDVVEILSNSEQRYWIERETKKQLQCLKQGLMQDLLSGTVRTTDTNINVPDEVAQHG